MERCFIVGGGPSLENFNWDLLQGRYVIAINTAFKMVPKADIVLFSDNDWFYDHEQLLFEHPGRKVKFSMDNDKINKEWVDEYELVRDVSQVSESKFLNGANSGFSAIQLALRMKFDEIMLLGLDGAWNRGKSHWHKEHKRVESDDTFRSYARNFEWLVPMVKESKSVVINLSPLSTIECFPKLAWEAFFSVSKNRNLFSGHV